MKYLGGHGLFSPSEIQSTSLKEELSIIMCIIQRHEMTCLTLFRRSATGLDVEPASSEPTFHPLNVGLSYLLQRKVPKRAAGSCSLNRNLANKPCLGQRVSYTGTKSSSLGASSGLCRERLLTGAGTNTFMGVLNQQGLVWLFPCTVLFEHVALQYARREFEN